MNSVREENMYNKWHKIKNDYEIFNRVREFLGVGACKGGF